MISKIIDYVTKERIVFNLKVKNKQELFTEMMPLFGNDIIEEGQEEKIIKELQDREAQSSTCMQDGIMIPHAKSEYVKKLALGIAIIKDGLNLDSLDEEPSKYFFMILAPVETKSEYLDILAQISKLSYNDELLEKLEEVENAEDVLDVLRAIG